jgi:formylglycine-generating enzyme required for sulfatase activity
MTSRPATRPALPQDPWRILRWRGRQLAYREELAPGVAGAAFTLLRLPAGHFWMGAPEEEQDSRSNERPVHRVSVGECLMGQTPVTQAQWRVVAQWQPGPNEEPWAMELDPDPVAKLEDSRRFLGDQRPVVNVSWHEAKEFCRRLRRRTGKHYTLPSEARWEYACRAGTTTPFHFGPTLTTELANYKGTRSYPAGDGDGDGTGEAEGKGAAHGAKGEYRRRTTEVASFPANAWGLQDMHGNVWEWCADHWHDNYEGAPEDGSPWLSTESPNGEERKPSGAARLLRGGSWIGFPRYCRSAYRLGDHPVARVDLVGFRVCCLPQDLILYT